jgi:hypothetical protein
MVVQGYVEEIVERKLSGEIIWILSPSNSLTMNIILWRLIIRVTSRFSVAKVTVIGWISIFAIIICTVPIIITKLAIATKATHDSLTFAGRGIKVPKTLHQFFFYFVVSEIIDVFSNYPISLAYIVTLEVSSIS